MVGVGDGADVGVVDGVGLGVMVGVGEGELPGPLPPQAAIAKTVATSTASRPLTVTS